MEELKNGNSGILHKKIASGLFKNIKKTTIKFKAVFRTLKHKINKANFFEKIKCL